MATSGTTSFAPSVSEFQDESWERCGLDPANLTLRHITSARRSMNLLLADWHNHGVKQWQIDLVSQATTVGMTSFTPSTGTVDIFDAVLRRDSIDTPMERIARHDYQVIPTKTTQGRPDRFFLDRNLTLAVNIYPAGENTTDTIRYYRLARTEDVGVASNTLDLPFYWFEAFAAGLAYKLAEKWAPDRYDALRSRAEAAFKMARMEDREKVAVTMNVRMK